MLHILSPVPYKAISNRKHLTSTKNTEIDKYARFPSGDYRITPNPPEKSNDFYESHIVFLNSCLYMHRLVYRVETAKKKFYGCSTKFSFYGSNAVDTTKRPRDRCDIKRKV